MPRTQVSSQFLGTRAAPPAKAPPAAETRPRPRGLMHNPWPKPRCGCHQPSMEFTGWTRIQGKVAPQAAAPKPPPLMLFRSFGMPFLHHRRLWEIRGSGRQQGHIVIAHKYRRIAHMRGKRVRQCITHATAIGRNSTGNGNALGSLCFCPQGVCVAV